MNFIDQHKDQFEKTLQHLRSEISGLRTGRATPAIVEDITVDAYGTKQPLKSLASITVADAKTINVQPWDRSLLQGIESAIRNAPVGINPVNDGEMIRLILPDLTQDRRQELIKVLHNKLEDARIAIRKIREEVRDNIDRSEKEKAISEDQKFNAQENLEKAVKEYNERVKEIGEEKEKEITTI